ncbi:MULTISPECIES: helix-turn-helix transcriptional regulator [Streptomyces]|uniref:Helix-turn-helix transcriptional regulator n=1 Tax=Streptomyces californicus TaxID=67351 RepID=A0ABD7D7T6_9ACTN|nr:MULTISPECIES: helix-turn-helix transcriptional regulator [Streptomyces]MBD3545903.1 helix-turn-helix transcriptional regulator [Streptomyces sp. JV180]QRV31978.1 helix-turn-helix transcriptional regulator [Streptomyces californicus]QRV38864.1 helix-turn-helix transcriptional regulator [Streptomyces californicus]QRV45394.1 helix-turn-helix transcriptional regulator [Streptomyces californicus]QRV52077.1 helix-turn-helix transcriptional regulator [Streptomyces californicus]
MEPGHVAYGMRASFGTTHVSPEHVIAWERGTHVPDLAELTALAAALWCQPGELMGRPSTLLEHRVARGVSAEEVARATGLTVEAYLAMEETGRWTGDKRQSVRLGEVLALPARDFIAVTGLEAELAGLLTEAVSTRWQAHVRAIAKLISMDRRELKAPLSAMQQEYQSLMAATLSRAGGTTASGEDGRRYVEHIVDHFWSRLPGGA